MNRSHLQPKQEYIDRYDLITIEACRLRENFHKSFTPSENASKVQSICIDAFTEVTLHIDLLFVTLNCWEKKEQTITEWMNADKHRDEMITSAHAPENIRCLKCFASLIPDGGDIHDLNGEEHVMYFYSCPNRCLPLRAIFENGEEYKTKLDLCPKCKTVTRIEHKRTQEKITMLTTCPSCDYSDTYELELGEKKIEVDPNFEKDRARFCLTEESGRKAQDERFRLERMGRLVDKMKEEEKNKADYGAIKEIQKLTVVELEALLLPIVEDAGYVKLQFGSAEIGKDVFLPFTIHDAKSGRTDRESSYTLQQLIKKTLKETNWRLMSDGISYRLGILTGRLRAYEREEDLLHLVRDGHKKSLRPQSSIE